MRNQISVDTLLYIKLQITEQRLKSFREKNTVYSLADMSSGPDELENFLQVVVHPNALGKARQICTSQDIYTVADLAGLRDANQLIKVFTQGTAFRIDKALSGRSCPTQI